MYTVCMHSVMVAGVAKCFSVAIPERVERTAFSHMLPALHTAAASQASGDHILLSFARNVLNSLFKKMVSKVMSNIKGRHQGV